MRGSKGKQITNPLTGQTMNIREWADHLGIKSSTMYQRVAEQWPPELLFAPGGTVAPRPRREYEIDGETRTISEWCKLYGKHPLTVGARLRRGADIKTALNAPTEWTPGPKATQYTLHGETKTLAEWAKEFQPQTTPLSLAAQIGRARRESK